MTWRGGRSGWDQELVPESECDLYHLVEGLRGSDAPTGQPSIIMACIIRYERLKRVVELGVYHGGTTGFLADACRDTGGMCWGVDKEECWEAQARIEWLGLTSYFTFLHGRTMDVPLVTDIDLLFIDDGHTLVEVNEDWMRWSPCVRPGGWVFIDNTVSEAGVRGFYGWLEGTANFRKDWEAINVTSSYGMAMLRRREGGG